MAFFKVPRYGLLTAIFVSFAAHTLLLTLEMHSPPDPSRQSSAAGSRILLLSARQAVSSNKDLPRPVQPQVQATKNLEAVEQDAPALSPPAESLETATLTPAPQEPSANAISELKLPEAGSVLPALLNETIFPGGSPNRGKWGQRSGPPPFQSNAQGNRGPSFVVPFLQSISTRLATGVSCDIKVSDTWTSAQISCTDSGSTSLIAGFLSQQLQIVNPLPDAGYCFQVKPGELNTLSCN